MKPIRTPWRSLGAGLLLTASLARADSGCITAQGHLVVSRYKACAQVEPIAVLPVKSVTAGVLHDLNVIPGTRVQAGQTLATLGGPEVEAALAEDEAAVRSARAGFTSAREMLAVEQRQLISRLSTHQAVLHAKAAMTAAEARVATAEAKLRVQQIAVKLTAPADGIVLAVTAAAGERVAAGQTLLTLESSGSLWLRAFFYGADASAIHPGMTGQFTDLDRREAVPVKVAAVSASLNRDGGEAVGLVATSPNPGWSDGEAGTLALDGSARRLIAVPTRALILDRGRWWVLLRTPQGDRPQEVVPGPARGWQTFLERGVEPGAKVMVENAYLEFHRSISKNYQPPD